MIRPEHLSVCLSVSLVSLSLCLSVSLSLCLSRVTLPWAAGAVSQPQHANLLGGARLPLPTSHEGEEGEPLAPHGLRAKSLRDGEQGDSPAGSQTTVRS